MSRQTSGQWTYFLKVVIAVGSVVVLMCVLVCAGAVLWNELWYVPRLVYTVLPTYVVRDQNVNGLVVENRGRAAAHEVLIRVVDLDQDIETFTIKTSEQITLKEGDEHNIAVRVDRIVPASSVTLYVPTEQSVALEDYLSITAEEGRALPATGPRELDSIVIVGLIGVMALLVLVIGGLIGWILARASAKG